MFASKKAIGIATFATLASAAALAAAGAADAAPVSVHSRGIANYQGSFVVAGNPPISVSTSVRNGRPRAVRQVHFMSLPVTCETTGANTFDASAGTGAPLPGPIRVSKRTRSFSLVNYSFVSGSVTGTETFTGKFSRNWRKLRGTYQATVHFPADATNPEETCTSETFQYKTSYGITAGSRRVP
jgi:hypothetical protein